MKRILPVAILVLAVGASWALYKARPEVVTEVAEPPALLVDIAVAQREPVTFTVESQGSVAPRTQTTMVAEASGVIVEVSPNFVSGGFFRKGDVLVRIDPRNYSAIVKRASAAVAQAETQLATESAMAGYAKEDYERLRALNPGTGPASPLTLRKPQLAAAIAQLQSAKADLEKAKGDLERTVLRAPYDGLVRQKIADVGQYVNTGTQLAVTFAIDKVEVRLPVTQSDLRYLDTDRLRSGQSLDVLLRAELGGQELTWPAKITRSEGVFDAASRVLYLVAEIADPYGLISGQVDITPLLVGTFVSAEIAGRPGGSLFVVPRHSVHRGETVWLVDEDMRIRPSVVTVERADDKYFYISAGLSEGDEYCATAVDQPLPGMRIRVGV